MEVDEHVFLVHHVSNVRFLIIVGFPAGTNDVRRRRPRQTPLSRRNTRRCTRRPRTTSTHARLFQEAGPLIPLPSQENHPLRCIQPATALQFDSHQSSLFDSRYLQRNNNHESRGWTEDQMYILLLSFIYIYQRDSAIIRDSRFENVINNLDFKVYIYTYILCNNIRIYIHIVLKN